MLSFPIVFLLALHVAVTAALPLEKIDSHQGSQWWERKHQLYRAFEDGKDGDNLVAVSSTVGRNRRQVILNQVNETTEDDLGPSHPIPSALKGPDVGVVNATIVFDTGEPPVVEQSRLHHENVDSHVRADQEHSPGPSPPLVKIAHEQHEGETGANQAVHNEDDELGPSHPIPSALKDKTDAVAVNSTIVFDEGEPLVVEQSRLHHEDTDSHVRSDAEHSPGPSPPLVKGAHLKDEGSGRRGRRSGASPMWRRMQQLKAKAEPTEEPYAEQGDFIETADYARRSERSTDRRPVEEEEGGAVVDPGLQPRDDENNDDTKRK